MYRVLLKKEFGGNEDCLTDRLFKEDLFKSPLRYHSMKNAKKDIKDFIEETNEIEGNNYSYEDFEIIVGG